MSNHLERKYTPKPTGHQIAEAFAQECKQILPEKIKKLKEELRPYLEFRKKVEDSDLNDEAKGFWIQVLKLVYSPKDKFDELQNYKNILKSVERGAEPAGHIGEDEILAAKFVLIEDLYDFENYKATPSGFKASCPFNHQDKTPSFSVKNNRFYCFSCQKKGDTIDFIMNLKGLKFLEAVRLILESV